MVRDVSTVIVTRKDQWNNERRRKEKVEYTFVCWISEDSFLVNSRPADEKITLEAGDQVYIKGHHAPGLDFISDVTKRENRTIKEVNKGIREENRRAREREGSEETPANDDEEVDACRVSAPVTSLL